MHGDIDRLLIPKERIAARIAELGEQIAADYAALDDEGEIVLVPILTGSIIFVADLMRRLPLKLRIDLVIASSYPGPATSSQGVHLANSLPEHLADRHVLIVDDVFDTGRTIREVRQAVLDRRPRSVRTCVLLRKRRAPDPTPMPCEYVGFDIPDEFVVGYGLDYDNYYRNLPDVATLRREAMGR